MGSPTRLPVTRRRTQADKAFSELTEDINDLFDALESLLEDTHEDTPATVKAEAVLGKVRNRYS